MSQAPCLQKGPWMRGHRFSLCSFCATVTGRISTRKHHAFRAGGLCLPPHSERALPRSARRTNAAFAHPPRPFGSSVHRPRQPRQR
jgi:hypothetical protein